MTTPTMPPTLEDMFTWARYLLADGEEVLPLITGLDANGGAHVVGMPWVDDRSQQGMLATAAAAMSFRAVVDLYLVTDSHANGQDALLLLHMTPDIIEAWLVEYDDWDGVQTFHQPRYLSPIEGRIVETLEKVFVFDPVTSPDTIAHIATAFDIDVQSLEEEDLL
jgi:hypothetical protein